MKYITVFCCSLLISCSSNKVDIRHYQLQEAIISQESPSVTKSSKFYTTSEDTNVIALVIKEKFNDTIGIIINNKLVDEFSKKDTTDCDDCPPNMLFKHYKINYKTDNIKLYLKNEKKYIDIKLNDSYRTYIISRYNLMWYINLWPK
ncbi:hypothetical protein ACLI08_16340 [Flavobacterium sp. RNTU_13]|uniref:hypothetical protein n=1 Tax=Flavobacterium sp. RNTU_13 TaxID=3375145 RepID=UPI00398731AA